MAPAARDRVSGIQVARDRSKDIGKRRAVLTNAGSTTIAARLPNELVREIERRAAHDLLSVSDYLRLALLEKIRADRKREGK
jgi:hypothetical protein